MSTEAVSPKLSLEAPSIASFDTSKIGPSKHAHTHRDPRQALAAQANSRKGVPSVVTALNSELKCWVFSIRKLKKRIAKNNKKLFCFNLVVKAI